METTVQQAVPQDEPRLEAADVDNPLDQQEDNELDEVGDAFPKKPKKHPIVVVIIMIFAFLSQLSVVVYCAHLGKQHEHVFSWDREHSVTYISITEYLDAIVFSLMFTVSPLLCFFGTCVTPVYIVAPYLFAPLYVEKLQRTICVLFRATTYMILPALLFLELFAFCDTMAELFAHKQPHFTIWTVLESALRLLLFGMTFYNHALFVRIARTKLKIPSSDW